MEYYHFSFNTPVRRNTKHEIIISKPMISVVCNRHSCRGRGWREDRIVGRRCVWWGWRSDDVTSGASGLPISKLQRDKKACVLTALRSYLPHKIWVELCTLSFTPCGYHISYMGLIRGVRDFTPVCKSIHPDAEGCIDLQTGVKSRTFPIRPITNLFAMFLSKIKLM
jgi:hypothetical protein